MSFYKVLVNFSQLAAAWVQKLCVAITLFHGPGETIARGSDPAHAG